MPIVGRRQQMRFIFSREKCTKNQIKGRKTKTKTTTTMIMIDFDLMHSRNVNMNVVKSERPKHSTMLRRIEIDCTNFDLFRLSSESRSSFAVHKAHYLIAIQYTQRKLNRMNHLSSSLPLIAELTFFCWHIQLWTYTVCSINTRILMTMCHLVVFLYLSRPTNEFISFKYSMMYC